jgi:hypothetical protein
LQISDLQLKYDAHFADDEIETSVYGEREARPTRATFGRAGR